jgi:hypothetical protein
MSAPVRGWTETPQVESLSIADVASADAEDLAALLDCCKFDINNRPPVWRYTVCSMH